MTVKQAALNHNANIKERLNLCAISTVYVPDEDVAYFATSQQKNWLTQSK